MIALRHPGRLARWSTTHDVTETGGYVHRILLAVLCLAVFSPQSFSHRRTVSLSFGHAIVTSLYNAPGECVPWQDSLRSAALLLSRCR